jgi:hypothetical protein
MPKIDLGKILTPRNRGILLDVVVFAFQLVLMTVLTRLFADLVRQAHQDFTAKVIVVFFCLGLAFLQPLGAILKRRRAHHRHPGLDVPAPRLLFHPIFYFLSKLLFLIAAGAQLVDLVYGEAETGSSASYFGLPPWLFTTLFLGIPALAIANTAIAYFFYFSEPKHAPLLKFLESPQSETLGDTCLFLNMIGYQMFWGFLMVGLTKDYSSIGGRLSTFGFTALLIYFPPRLFYLAEDGNRRLTWLTMLLANSPILFRIFLA